MASNKGTMSLRMSAAREEAILQVMRLTGEKTKAGAIDVALKHYAQDYRNKEMLIDELDPALVEDLNTAYLPMTMEISTSVGKDLD